MASSSRLPHRLERRAADEPISSLFPSLHVPAQPYQFGVIGRLALSAHATKARCEDAHRQGRVGLSSGVDSTGPPLAWSCCPALRCCACGFLTLLTLFTHSLTHITLSFPCLSLSLCTLQSFPTVAQALIWRARVHSSPQPESSPRWPYPNRPQNQTQPPPRSLTRSSSPLHRLIISPPSRLPP